MYLSFQVTAPSKSCKHQMLITCWLKQQLLKAGRLILQWEQQPWSAWMRGYGQCGSNTHILLILLTDFALVACDWLVGYNEALSSGSHKCGRQSWLQRFNSMYSEIFHQKCCSTFQKGPRSGSLRCSIENTCLAYFWQTPLRAAWCRRARQEVKHRNGVENTAEDRTKPHRSRNRPQACTQKSPDKQPA